MTFGGLTTARCCSVATVVF